MSEIAIAINEILRSHKMTTGIGGNHIVLDARLCGGNN